MKQIGNWHVANLDGGKRLAYTREESGDCFVASQARGGGRFSIVRFKCPDAVFKKLIENNGDAGEDSRAIEFLDALDVPAGLVDALLS